MAIYTKMTLSESSYGKAIKITQTSSPGTLIHTANSSALDEVWIYASNSQTTTIKVTIEWGGTTTPDDTIEAYIPAKSGLFLIIPGLILTNSCQVRAFADTANAILIHGFVNRIIP